MIIQNAFTEAHNIFLRYFQPRDEQKIHGWNIQYHCPNENCPGNIIGNHSYNKDKLSVSYDLFVFNCWLCEFSGSLSTLAYKYFNDRDRKRFNEIKSSFQEIFKDKNNNFTKSINDLQLYIKNFEPFLSFDNDDGFLDFNKKNALNYLFQRDIGFNHLYFYNIMFSRHAEFQNRIIVPSYSADGIMNFFVSRIPQDNIKHPYKNPNIKKNFIFNEYLIDWSKELIIVEGVFDYLKLHGYNRTVLLGSSLDINSELFKKIIENKTNVNLLLDKDVINKGYVIIEKLNEWGVDVKYGTEVLEKFNIKDPAEIKSVVDTMKQIQATNTIHNKFDLLKNKLKLIKE